jgi:CBS domain-containing protein
MLSCERLRRNHALIGEVLVAVEGIVRLQERGRTAPMSLFAGATEFFTAFVERCHEAAEEQALLPVLTRLGLLDDDVLRTVRGDHAEMRRLLGVLRPLCARRETGRDLAALLGSYVALERGHLALEEALLLPKAERGLSASDDARVQQEIDRIEESALGSGGRDVLVALAGALTQACRALGAGGPREPSELVARDLIRAAPGTLAPEDSLSRAVELMESFGSRELAVIERDRLVGILSRSDLEPHRGHLEWTAVRTAMTADPVSVPPEAPIRAVAQLLLDRGFNAVPVATNRRFLGMLRRSDLLRLLSGREKPPADTSPQMEPREAPG